MNIDRNWAIVVCVALVVLGTLIGLGKLNWEVLPSFMAGVVIPMLKPQSDVQAK